jgi:RND family efflux transporter MFP subunit
MTVSVEAKTHSTPAPVEKPAPDDTLPKPGPALRRPRILIIIGVVVVLVLVFALYARARSKVNHVPLTAAPRPVSVAKAKKTTFRSIREYVGTTDAWNSAKIGPQYISAYVGTVLVRPGAIVRRGQVLATLDCRNPSAGSREMAARAKAMQERQTAIEHETQRTKELVAGGFASTNEIEQLSSRAASQQSEFESLQASLVSRSLEVDDCILRAPFDGEVTERYVDPGAFLRPGEPVAKVIDRNVVRVSADAPESDFIAVAPGTPVEISVQANASKVTFPISRRAPAADSITRTVHFEVDVQNPGHEMPAGATARLVIRVGEPQPAIEVPLVAAVVRGEKASLFSVENGKAKRITATVLGELNGLLYIGPTIPGGTEIVVQGRALLDDGDAVTTKEVAQ